MRIFTVKKLPAAGLLTGLITLFAAGSASAHVVVSPNRVLTAERATFAVSVPNEHDTPVVAVRLVIPEGLTSVRPFAKAGWRVEVKTSGSGEEVSATEINWISDGSDVPVNLKDEFLFGAKAPGSAGELIWKAYETYADGRVVGWEQEPTGEQGNKPYSVTRVVNESDEASAARQAETEAAAAKTAANRALYVGGVGLVLGLAGIALASRKQS